MHNQQQLLRKIDSLEHEVERLKKHISHPSLELPDREALDLIRSTLLQLKKRGTITVDVILIYHETNLPLEQISRLMNVLEKEGVISPGD